MQKISDIIIVVGGGGGGTEDISHGLHIYHKEKTIKNSSMQKFIQ